MRYTHSDNALPLGPLMRWLVLVIFLGVLGLSFVHMKHRLKIDGDRRRDLEQAVAQLDEKLKVANNEIMRLTSRPALERRRQEGFIQMMPVQDSRMVRLRAQTTPAIAQSSPVTEKEALP